MAAVEIPLISGNQAFEVTLANVAYRMTLIWRGDVDTGGYILDIADQNGSPILTGIPLVTGADLLAQYGYLNFGGQLIVQTDHNVDAVPTYANLGSSSHLYFVTPD